MASQSKWVRSENLERIFNPSSVAIIGVSAEGFGEGLPPERVFSNREVT